MENTQQQVLNGKVDRSAKPFWMFRVGATFWTFVLMSMFRVGALASPLQVGDPAPPIKIGKWLKGDPVVEFSPDKVYLVEFWATWCGPCVRSIPHLSALADKYQDKGLVVIGQNVWEDDESKVEPFLKEMGSKIRYSVASDDLTSEDKTTNRKGAMGASWLTAAGENGIPTAFLIGMGGKIAYIGHPAFLEESVIEEVLAKKFDLSKAAADYVKKREQGSKLNEIQERLFSQFNKKQWSEAEVTLDEFYNALPDKRREIVLDKRVELLLLKGDSQAAINLAKELYPKLADSGVAAMIARRLISEKNPSPAAIAAAVDGAGRANEKAGGKDGFILETLAKAEFLNGEKEKAITHQTKALELEEIPRFKKRIQATLDSYRADRIVGPLEVGLPAPHYKHGKWLKGDPITEFSRDNVYLVDFWSIGLRHCVGPTLRMNQLAAKYKNRGLIVIGQNVNEQDERKVLRFIKMMGEKMSYGVALDDAAGGMAQTWLNVAGQSQIPRVFLIGKDGRIAFIGDAMDLKESVIEEVLAGEFDLNTAVANLEKERQIETQKTGLLGRFYEQCAAMKWSDAETTLVALGKLLPDDRRQIVLEKRVELLLGKGEWDEAAAVARLLCTGDADQTIANNIAYKLLAQDNASPKALAVALELAIRANEGTGDKHACTLDTLARAEFLNGHKERAIELETKAVKLAEDAGFGRYQKEFQDTLNSYKAVR